MSDLNSTNGTIAWICVSEKKGTPKHTIEVADLHEEHGIIGDAHAGEWHRQLSLLSLADIKSIETSVLDLKPGIFAENLGIDGIDFDQIGIGSRLSIGDCSIEITQIGKVCHDRCAIFKTIGDCVMPRAGLFARIITGGRIVPGLDVNIDHLVPRDKVQVAVLTVSDRCSRGETIDTAGPKTAELLTGELDANLTWRGIVEDDQKQIEQRLINLSDRRVDLIVTVGGTGVAPRDVTPEATMRVINREVPGIAEAMRDMSLSITDRAMLQRGRAGIRNNTLIVNLPGSEKGAIENLQVILPVLPHVFKQLRGENDHFEDSSRLIKQS